MPSDSMTYERLARGHLRRQSVSWAAWALLFLIHSSIVHASQSSHSRAGGTEPTIAQIKELMQLRETPGRPDCNENGIDDATDIRLGWDDDKNRNGQIDYCDSDSAIRRFARSDTTWRRLAVTRDTSYFLVRTRGEHRVPNSAMGVLIRYTIPHGVSEVTLRVRSTSSSRVDTMLVNHLSQSGAHELMWDQKFRGRFVPIGTYRFDLQVGDRRYRRKLSWATWPL